MLTTLSLISQDKNYMIYGTVVEAGTTQYIDYVSVIAMDVATEKMITGTTTANGGEFELSVPTDNVYLELSFIGMSPLTIDDINFIDNKLDLGLVSMGEASQTLDEVIVRAEKSTTEYKLDKRVFNVGSDLSSSGAGALDVLDNVPSVSVSIEGEIALRGSTGVQILINGKPSILADEASGALGTITADMIDKVEVITNPSAKYEAEGTAGIINIVLKKEEKRGMNGSLTVNTGVPHNHSVGLSLNRRSEKFNLFTQLGVGYRELPRDQENINRDIVNNTELISEGEQFRNEFFYNVILGSDYYIDPNNVITLSGSFTYEVEDQPSETDFSFFSDDVLQRTWNRTEVTEATNPKLQYELNYTREFKDDEDHQLLFSAIGNYFGKEQSSLFVNDFSFGDADQTDQTTATAFDEGKFTFKLDYTKPFNDLWTIELGSQYLLNDVSNDFTVSNESNGSFVVDPDLTNLFEYDQKVLGLYTTASYEGEYWGIMLGLRAENTDLSTLLVNTNEVNSQNFTNLFPSAHTSYKLTEAISFQAGYSRRIYRPRLWDLNPFFNIRNNFSIRAGNPDLQPEFSDSYEVGGIFIYEKITFNVNLYYRYTTNSIERVSTFIDNVNIFRPENIGVNKSTGIEGNFKLSPVNKLTINGDLNYNVFSKNGRFNDQVFDFSADRYSTDITFKYKWSKLLDVEVSGEHESREQTIQGTRAANTFMNLGLRYKILKGRGIFNISVRDVFASRIRKTEVDQEDFYLFSRSLRGRFITFGFSYGFGKGEAMQYSGGRRR